jgi:menaquinone-dependent protoporphyrinogen oxidase
MRVLVTAASKYGATAEIASAIGRVLADRGIDAVVLPPEDVGSVDEYDAVVLGSGVYAGHWMKAARELVDRSGESIASRPVWLFSSGPVGDPPKPQEEAVDVAAIMETTRAREHHVFVGKIEKKQLSFGDKAIAVAFRVQDGDYRDWDEIRSWASGIADALGTSG